MLSSIMTYYRYGRIPAGYLRILDTSSRGRPGRAGPVGPARPGPGPAAAAAAAEGAAAAADAPTAQRSCRER